jgi:hypothetical protein
MMVVHVSNNLLSLQGSTAISKAPSKKPFPSQLETIRDDRGDHPEVNYVESRDDYSVPSIMDDDLVVPHLFGRTGSNDELREEAIEIVNMSFLHE